MKEDVTVMVSNHLQKTVLDTCLIGRNCAFAFVCVNIKDYKLNK